MTATRTYGVYDYTPGIGRARGAGADLGGDQ